MADDFILPSATTVLSVSWQGAYYPDGIAPLPDNFTILFFPDVAGSPGSAPFASFTVGNNVNRQSAGFSFPVGHTFPVFDYQANIPGGIPIPANTTVWISILNDSAGTRHWGWATRFPDGGPTVLNPSRRSADGGTTWPESWTDNTQTFSLHDTAIPEPVSSGLLCLGSLLLLGNRRRIKVP